MPQNKPKHSDIDKLVAEYSDQRLDQEADRQGVPRDFVRKIAGAESSGRPDIINGMTRSRTGAIGKMQLMPGTAKELGVDPEDLDGNIRGGVSYAGKMLKEFGGDLTKAAAAYNAGPGAVRKYGGVPPYAETQAYVKKVATPAAPESDIDKLVKEFQQGQQAPAPDAAPIVPAKPFTRPPKPGPIRNPQMGPIVTPEQRQAQNAAANPFSFTQPTLAQGQAQAINARTRQISPEVAARADAAGRELGQYQRKGTLGKIGYDLKTGYQSAANTLADQVANLGEVAGGIATGNFRPAMEQAEGAGRGLLKVASGLTPGGGAMRAQQNQGVEKLQQRQQARRANDPYWLGSQETQRNVEARKAVNPSLAAQTVRGGTEAAIGTLPIIAASAAGGGLPAVMGITAAQQDYTRPDDAAANLAGAYLSTKAGQAISPAAATLAQRIGGPATLPTIPQEIARRGVEGIAGGLTNTAQYAGTQLATGRPIDTQEAIVQGLTGGVMGTAMAPGRRATGEMLARDAGTRAVQAEASPLPQMKRSNAPQQTQVMRIPRPDGPQAERDHLARVQQASDANFAKEGQRRIGELTNEQKVLAAELDAGATTDRQQAIYARLGEIDASVKNLQAPESAQPSPILARKAAPTPQQQAIPPAAAPEAAPTTGPRLAGEIAGIRVMAENEVATPSQRRHVRSFVLKNADGSPQTVRAVVPQGMKASEAKRALQMELTRTGKADAPQGQPDATEPLTSTSPRNRAISRGREIEQQARAEADAALQEGRIDDARAALKRRLAALQDTRNNVGRGTPGGTAVRSQLGEQIFRTQEELRGLNQQARTQGRTPRAAAQPRPVVENAPTRDLTEPLTPDAPQTARMEPPTDREAVAPNRPTPRTEPLAAAPSKRERIQYRTQDGPASVELDADLAARWKEADGRVESARARGGNATNVSFERQRARAEIAEVQADRDARRNVDLAKKAEVDSRGDRIVRLNDDLAKEWTDAKKRNQQELERQLRLLEGNGGNKKQEARIRGVYNKKWTETRDSIERRQADRDAQSGWKEAPVAPGKERVRYIEGKEQRAREVDLDKDLAAQWREQEKSAKGNRSLGKGYDRLGQRKAILDEQARRDRAGEITDEPTNQLRDADYPGGEVPRTAGLRPEGQPVEIPAERMQENTNRLPGAEYAGGEVRRGATGPMEGQPVETAPRQMRPPAPPRPAGGRNVERGPNQYGPTTMSAAFPRSRRGLVVEGRRVQEEIEAGRGDKGEFGKLAQAMFKSTSGEVAHGQDSFFHDPDVKGALGLTRDAEQGEVRAALKRELARVMGVKSEEVSLTQVPPQAWQNWAGMKQIGAMAKAKLQTAIQKYQRPILDELQKTVTPPDSSPPQPVSTDRGSTPKAPSDYQRFRDANAKAIAALNSVSAADAATPGGKRKFDAAADRLRKSAKQMGIDPSHADAIITDAMNAQMEAARRADADARPVEATPAQEAPREAPAPKADDLDVVAARQELEKVKSQIDAAYWTFTRQAKAKPPSAELYKRQVELETKLGIRREWWQKTQEQAQRQAGMPANIHKARVKQALAEGKPVPAEVLADYPDLAPKAPDAPPVAETRPSVGNSVESVMARWREIRPAPGEVVYGVDVANGGRFTIDAQGRISRSEIIYNKKGNAATKRDATAKEIAGIEDAIRQGAFQIEARQTAGAIGAGDVRGARGAYADTLTRIYHQSTGRPIGGESRPAEATTDPRAAGRVNEEKPYTEDDVEKLKAGGFLRRHNNNWQAGDGEYWTTFPGNKDLAVITAQEYAQNAAARSAEAQPRAVSEADAAPIATGDAGKAVPKAKRAAKAKAAAPAKPAAKEPPILRDFGAQKQVSRSDMEGELRRMGMKPEERHEFLNEYGGEPFIYDVPGKNLGNQRNAVSSDRQGYAYRRNTAEQMLQDAYTKIHGEEAYKRALDTREAAQKDYAATQAANEQARAESAARDQEAYRDDDVFAYQKEKIAKIERDLTAAPTPAARRMLQGELERAKARLVEMDAARAKDAPAAPATVKDSLTVESPAEQPPAGKIDGKDVTADEMAVYDALAKVQPRLTDAGGAAASLTQARAEAGLSKEAFDRAALSLADKEILALHAADFPQSLSPEGRAALVQGKSAEYIAAALRTPGAKVEKAGAAAEMPVFTESEIITGKPQTTRQKRVNGVSGNVSVEVQAPYKITNSENWSKIDSEKTRATVRGYLEYATGKAPSRKDPVWSVYDQRKNRIVADLTYAEALSYAKSHVLSANPQPSNASAVAPAKPARKPRVKGSVGKLDRDESGGTTLGFGFGALQGMGKLFSRDAAIPKDVDAWVDKISRGLHGSMDGASLDAFDNAVTRGEQAARNGDKAGWNKYRRQAEALLQAQPERDTNKLDTLRSPLSNLNFKGTYERRAGEMGKEISEMIRNAQVEIDRGADRNEVTRRLRRDAREYEQALRYNNLTGLAQMLKDHVDYLSRPEGAWDDVVRKARATQYNLKLRFNPRSTAVNLLQPFQTLWPHMSTADFARVSRRAASAEAKKRIDDIFGEETGLSAEEAKAGRKWDLFGKASAYNRRVGYLAGEMMADRLGMTGEAKDRLARDWAKKVEFDTSKYDAPPLFQGNAAGLLLQFKAFQVKNIERIIADAQNAPEGSITGKKARIGKMVFSQMAIGGLNSIPGSATLGGLVLVGAMAHALKGAGMSDEASEKAAEAFYYGLPALVGLDFSGSVGILDAPFGKTMAEKAVNYLGGPTGSTIVKLAEEGKTFFEAEDSARGKTAEEKQGNAVIRAAKTITPYTKTAIAGYSAIAGALGKRKGMTPDLPISGKPTPMTPTEAVGFGLMGTPVRQSKFYDEEDMPDWQRKLRSKITGQPVKGKAGKTAARPARPALPPPLARKPKGFGDL